MIDTDALEKIVSLQAKVKTVASARPKNSSDFRPLLDHPEDVLFLDIETTGLSKFYDYTTLIGYQARDDFHVWLRGQDQTHFLNALAKARSIVTFNGSGFDLPFLHYADESLRFPPHHVDLRYACKKIGLTGGQKAIEKELGIDCREGLEDVDGGMAVVLWHRYLRGDKKALATLIDYNRADVRAMAHILDHVIEQSHLPELIDFRRPGQRFADFSSTRRGLATKKRLPVQKARDGALAFERIFGGTKAEGARIAGLDLTGSGERLSGYCLLDGSHASTATLGEDSAIIDAICRDKPDLISIDSPLCLPVGRTSVFDDDPNRKAAGILRVSERILKRRGINVYPCLLPSMQKLTARGIGLAQKLRSLGFLVIECYPGAAQDIMGIPRKGAGPEWLQIGLSDFGILGDYQRSTVTHDELDAITCSLVGAFHLAGLSEAINGPGEEPMIIPDLNSQGELVVGISGKMYAGKTTAARHLESLGFAYTRISEVIDDELESRGMVKSRENRQHLGLELHQTKGQRWLCSKAIERVGPGRERVVVDGLRWKEDARYLRERFGGKFLHIDVVSPAKVRKARALDEGSTIGFIEAENHGVEAGVEDVGQLADVSLKNDVGKNAFYRAIDGCREGIFHAN